MQTENSNKACVFCHHPSPVKVDYSTDIHLFSCPRCGNYAITQEAYDDHPEAHAQWELAAGYIRELNNQNRCPERITNENYEHIFDNHLIPHTISQKLDKVLLHFYRHSNVLGKTHILKPGDDYAIAYTKFPDEIRAIVYALKDAGQLTDLKAPRLDEMRFRLTVEGITHAESLLQTASASSKVFVATQFRQAEGYPFHYTMVRDEAIIPAVKEACGLTAFTVDQKEHNEYITDYMIAEIKTSRFLIADLTHNNNGAYWEAGYAKGLGKAVIYICNQNWLDEKDEIGAPKHKIHFDVEQINCIRWKTLEELGIKLCNRIRATIV